MNTNEINPRTATVQEIEAVYTEKKRAFLLEVEKLEKHRAQLFSFDALEQEERHAKIIEHNERSKEIAMNHRNAQLTFAYFREIMRDRIARDAAHVYCEVIGKFAGKKHNVKTIDGIKAEISKKLFEIGHRNEHTEGKMPMVYFMQKYVMKVHAAEHVEIFTVDAEKKTICHFIDDEWRFIKTGATYTYAIDFDKFADADEFVKEFQRATEEADRANRDYFRKIDELTRKTKFGHCRIAYFDASGRVEEAGTETH